MDGLFSYQPTTSPILEKVSQMLVIDPEDNPYSFPALEYNSESAALLHVIQSISAWHKQYFSPYAPTVAFEKRGKALVSLRKELGQLQTTLLTSLLTMMLLALSHGADSEITGFGKQHLFATWFLVNQMLQNTSSLSGNDYLSWLCFGMYLYSDMACAFLIDPSKQQELDTLYFSITVHRMGLWHHPMYGSCTELLFILTNVGHYCRQILNDLQPCDPVREARLELQLYNWDLYSNPSLALLHSVLRMHGLIFLYRSTRWNHHFTTPDLKGFYLGSLIHYYASKAIHYPLKITMTLNCLNFQTLPFLSAGSELTRADNTQRDHARQRL